VKILVDTDVLVDVAMDRGPHAGPSGLLLNALEEGKAQGMVAWHSLSNFHYLASPRIGRGESRRFLTELLAFVRVVPAGHREALAALQSPMADFEDALQWAAAQAGDADAIATRNVRDYRHSPIPAHEPSSLVKAIRP
jgi:predicted nucleic acid-binding protein